jgi:pilus assembly protein CpaC
MRELFPGEGITAVSNGRAVVLSGTVSSKYVAEKALEVAFGHVEKKDDVVSVLKVQEGPPAQVLLRVRFAEVTRNALTELGASYFTGPSGYKDWVGRGTTQQFPAPDFEDDKLVFSDFLNLFLFNTKHNVGTVIKALQNRGLFESLAEPNLVAETGKEASFLAGGEIPIPVAQGTGGNVAISVMWKEFGVRLNFMPTVTTGGRVRLRVRPEVSTLDFANGVVLQGFRVPALSTRRTETELELANGQTFAIAGLLNNTTTEQMQKIPGIGDIPILGYLFRSKAANKNRTELVVMITPEILRTNSPGVTTEVPRLQEPYLAPLPENRSHPTPGPAFTPQGDNPALVSKTPRSAVVQPSPATAQPTAAEEAAALLRSHMGKAPTLVNPQPAAAAETTPAAVAADEPPATPAAAANTSTREPEARPLTKEEKKRLAKAREEERKAEERQAREEAKAAKQAQKEAEEFARKAAKENEKLMKEAEKAAKRSKD